MKVNLLLFGILKDELAQQQTMLELAPGACVRDVLSSVRGERASGVWDSLAVAVNREYATLETLLREGDEIALLPPVSGGASC